MVRIRGFCLVEVELRGLEPVTPCLQIAIISRVMCCELGFCMAMTDRGIPAVTGVHGTLMARSCPSRHAPCGAARAVRPVPHFLALAICRAWSADSVRNLTLPLGQGPVFG